MFPSEPLISQMFCRNLLTLFSQAFIFPNRRKKKKRLPNQGLFQICWIPMTQWTSLLEASVFYPFPFALFTHACFHSGDLIPVELLGLPWPPLGMRTCVTSSGLGNSWRLEDGIGEERNRVEVQWYVVHLPKHLLSLGETDLCSLWCRLWWVVILWGPYSGLENSSRCRSGAWGE